MPCKLTGSTIKLLQIQGKWYRERKPKKKSKTWGKKKHSTPLKFQYLDKIIAFFVFFQQHSEKYYKICVFFPMVWFQLNKPCQHPGVPASWGHQSICEDPTQKCTEKMGLLGFCECRVWFDPCDFVEPLTHFFTLYLQNPSRQPHHPNWREDNKMIQFPWRRAAKRFEQT